MRVAGAAAQDQRRN